MDTAKQNYIHVYLKNEKTTRLFACRKGLYKYNLEKDEIINWLLNLFSNRKPEENNSFNIETVRANVDTHTHCNRERAMCALKLENIIMRPDLQKFKRICICHLEGCPATPGEEEIAEVILDPNTGLVKGKTARRANSHVIPGIDPVPYQIMKFHKRVALAIDIMSVNKFQILVTLPQKIKFGTVEALPDKKYPPL